MDAGDGSAVVPNHDIGMSLTKGEETDAVVELLREEYGDAVRVSDKLTNLKVETSTGKLEIRFADVAERLGRPFGLADFQLIFATFYGRPVVHEDRIELSSSLTAGIL